MKHARRKTPEEIDDEATLEEMTVEAYNTKHRGYGYEPWYCSSCHVLHERDDKIIVRTHKGKVDVLCPRQKYFVARRFWGREQVHGRACKNMLSTGTMEYFEKEYHLDDPIIV